jgi:hypothetical protein
VIIIFLHITVLWQLNRLNLAHCQKQAAVRAEDYRVGSADEPFWLMSHFLLVKLFKKNLFQRLIIIEIPQLSKNSEYERYIK